MYKNVDKDEDEDKGSKGLSAAKDEDEDESESDVDISDDEEEMVDEEEEEEDDDDEIRDAEIPTLIEPNGELFESETQKKTMGCVCVCAGVISMMMRFEK